MTLPSTGPSLLVLTQCTRNQGCLMFCMRLLPHLIAMRCLGGAAEPNGSDSAACGSNAAKLRHGLQATSCRCLHRVETVRSVLCSCRQERNARSAAGRAQAQICCVMPEWQKNLKAEIRTGSQRHPTCVSALHSGVCSNTEDVDVHSLHLFADCSTSCPAARSPTCCIEHCSAAQACNGDGVAVVTMPRSTHCIDRVKT